LEEGPLVIYGNLFAMNRIQIVEIAVTTDNLWFLERYLNVFDFADLFPADAFATETERGVPVILHTDYGFDIESDLDRLKMQLRNRSKLCGWVRWTTEARLRIGDTIVIEKTGEREYSLKLIP
jgi:hypothetical protein